jgi:hypothetical protein
MKRSVTIKKLCENLVREEFGDKPKAEVMRTKPYKDKGDFEKNWWISDSISLEKPKDKKSKQSLEQVELRVRELFERKKVHPLCSVKPYEIKFTTDLEHIIDMIYNKYLDWDFVR